MNEQWTNYRIALKLAELLDNFQPMHVELLMRRMRAEMQAEIDRLTNVLGLAASWLSAQAEMQAEIDRLQAENKKLRQIIAAKLVLFDSEIDDMLAADVDELQQ